MSLPRRRRGTPVSSSKSPALPTPTNRSPSSSKASGSAPTSPSPSPVAAMPGSVTVRRKTCDELRYHGHLRRKAQSWNGDGGVSHLPIARRPQQRSWTFSWMPIYGREEMVRKTTTFDKMKDEAEKCVAQSERLSKEKEEFESAAYAKFVTILNSKKAKLREFRDQLAKQGSAVKLQREEESTDRTEAYDTSGSDSGSDRDVGTLKVAPQSKGRGRKRIVHN